MDLSMEFAGDPTVLYLRAPFLGAMGVEPGAAPLGRSPRWPTDGAKSTWPLSET